MTREEKCKLVIEKGITYNPETGKVYGVKGNEIINKILGYIRIGINIGNKKNVELKGHQFVWYYMYKECVDCIDHINGKRDDNRICNLRSVTQQENVWNRNDKRKGCNFFKSTNKWRARIKLNNKEIHLGFFKTEEEAVIAYNNAKEKYHNIG